MAKKTLVYAFLLVTLPGVAQPAGAGSPFKCRIRETHAFLEELQTFSGFRWIECAVGVEEAHIEGVSINGGACAAFDWVAGRTFVRGGAIAIPYACMSPVTLAIAANGVTWNIRLR